jgi:hypothetical protein
MTLDYSIPGEVTIRMDDYVSNLFEEAPEDMKGTAVIPAADYLFIQFTVSKEPEYLDETISQLFHHLATRLLFLCSQARTPRYPNTSAIPNNMGEASGQG